MTDGPARGEDERIQAALRVVPHEGDGVRLGPGHDCARLAAPDGELVVTSDVLVDGVHFDLSVCGGAAAARKALLVNLSDLAAAASRPVAFEVGVVLPRRRTDDLEADIARGLAEAARAWNCPCAGGDTNVADGPLVLAVTAFGRPGPGGRVLTRAGAAVGDRLSVTGPLGGSLGGRHLAFAPRIPEALALVAHDVPHAMMDLSDGLSRDLPRLCRASGVGARVAAAAVPVHADAAAARDGRSPLEHALDDGEDFELLLAHAPLDATRTAALRAAGVDLHEIGRVVPAAEGVHLVRKGRTEPLVARGWDHFDPR